MCGLIPKLPYTCSRMGPGNEPSSRPLATPRLTGSVLCSGDEQLQRSEEEQGGDGSEVEVGKVSQKLA